MKFKKVMSTIVAAIMCTSLFTNIPSNVKSIKAVADYSYLDQQAYSGNDLGAVYSPNSTTFKVWAPTATKVELKLYKTGSDSEPGAGVISTDAMSKGSNGIWSITKSGDLKNVYYTYLVTTNGTTKETVDLYAKAGGVNGNRGMVIDLDSTDPVGWENDTYVECKNQTDAIVWEAHVRDFSIDNNSGMSNKGKFLAFTEKNTTLNNDGKNPTGVNYLKKLGITHVQLLPIYDYATVDETKLNTDQYNWGYDPKNYNFPEGSYSTNPYDGNVRVNELKQAVQSLHNEGIGVIMDVVYNHTYDQNNNDSWFNRTVPGYYYRHDAKGFANGSGCGNETASERAMYQKYMVDSLKYWMTEYHIDGFRFDLMGLHDTDTMNLIKKELEKINPNVVIYGEPWNAGSTASSKPTATQGNMKLVDPEVGAFNDKIRDAIKGSCFSASAKGFIQGAPGFETALKAGIQANSTTMDSNQWSKQPSQTVTYTSAHDNYTLHDKLVKSYGGSFDGYDGTLAAMNKMAGGIILTSQGVSFIQAGEEFARTKHGDENSYKSPTSVNKIDWNRTVQYKDVWSYYSGLMEIRKAYSPLRDPSNTTNGTIYFSWGSNCPSNVVAFTMYNKLNAANEWNYMAVAHNSNSYSTKVTFQGYSSIPTEWVMIADGTNAGITAIKTVSGTTIDVPARSTVVLVDKASFNNYNPKPKGTVIVKHVDESTGAEIASSTTITGNVGDSYKSSSVDIDDYVLVSTPSNASGRFTEATQTVTYKYKYQPTAKGTVTVKYLDKATNKEIATATTMTGKEGTRYITTALTIKGYELDQSSLPSNASGTYTSGNINVVYYYNEKEVESVIVHYYNANSWASVNIYAYNESVKPTVQYTGAWPGTKMSSEGDNWYVYEVEDVTNAQVIFNNGGSVQEPGAKEPGYEVEGEVWIKNKTIYTEDPDGGKVVVKYVDQDTNVEIANSKTISGKVGESYNTSAVTVSGYELVSTPSNASGTIKSGTTTVTYKYKKVSQELKVNSYSTNLSSPQAVGTSIKLSMSASGGSGTLKYRFVAMKSGKVTYSRDYSTTSTATWTPAEAGTYTLYFKVKDGTGNETQKIINSYVMTGGVLKVTSSKTSVSSPQKTGTNITLSMSASGGSGNIKYRFVAMKSGKVTYSRDYSTTNTTVWKPTEAGTYTLYFKAKDSSSTEQQKSMTYVITQGELAVSSYKTSVSSPQDVGTNITLSMSGSGGNGTLKYRFVVMKSGKVTYSRDYSTTNTTTWKPTEAGKYTIYFKVKDSSGKIKESSINYVINTAFLINSYGTNLSSPQNKGTTITLRMSTTGGNGNKEYRFVAIKNGQRTFVRDYSSIAVTTWTPTESGTYTIYFKAKDSTGKEVEKSCTYVIR